MTKSNRGPRPGTGMKPRGNAAGTAVAEKSTEATEEKPVSTPEGQAGSAQEPETNPQAEPQTPPSLESGKPAVDAEEQNRLRGLMVAAAGERPAKEEGGSVAAKGLESTVSLHGIPEDSDVPPTVAPTYGGISRGPVEKGKSAVTATFPRPNGDLGVVIEVPEYYVEAVRQFAEADKKPVAQWATEFFVMMLEAYCKPNPGR